MTHPAQNPPVPTAPERIQYASQWRLMWLRWRRHKLAVWSATLLLVMYLTALLCPFLAPYTLDHRNIDLAYAPPQQLHVFGPDGFHLRPFVYGLIQQRQPETLRRLYTDDAEQRFPIRLFVRGNSFRLMGLFETDFHLFGVREGGSIHLLGTDSEGRDVLSRILYGARISLTIGLVGVALSFLLGMLMGAVSGYYGGWVDHLIQRVIEIIRCFPSLPLWMALAAALPRTWSPLMVYFGIIVVLSFIGWTGLARQLRGMVLRLREEDFVTAAVLYGADRRRLMWRYLLPGCMSHVLVSLSLAVPGMILGETALSFLGLGLRPPITSWGVLLQEAQSVQVVATAPWLLTPVLFVIVTVLAFNFVGDGLRDAADPYAA